MKSSEDLQLGITNFINDLLKVHIHRLKGWTLIKNIGSHPARSLDNETLLKQWLEKKLNSYLIKEKTGTNQI